MAAEDDNFFSRWSRRKVHERAGQPLPANPPAQAPDRPVVPAAISAAVPGEPAAASRQPPQPLASTAAAEPPPVLTLDDVAQLTRESDFKPFVARHVPAEVRNAAVKKLFADPHFNVMDGLDIYIDDYSQPSPLPAAMMAKMVGAQFLKLVDDPNEVKPPPATAAIDASTVATADTAIEATADISTGAATAPDQPEPHDDHADLQLQPDHAPEPQGPGRGAG